MQYRKRNWLGESIIIIREKKRRKPHHTPAEFFFYTGQQVPLAGVHYYTVQMNHDDDNFRLSLYEQTISTVAT